MNLWLPLWLLFAVWLFGREWSPRGTFPPENCENALDDDQDGLIDLNDPDCACTLIEPVSRIPNPSFEDFDCCPSSITQLHCADTWIQASTPTTDYLNTCGWMGWPDLPPPIPFPDGQGAVGFRDGRFIMGQAEPWWKEYVGACLLAPLLANIPYRIEFHLGFTNSSNSPPIGVSFFGTTDCANLPFGGGNEQFGCPTNGPGWTKLGQVNLSGSRRWVKAQIDIVPREDIYAITIGPDCPDRPAGTSYYYFIDNLILDEQAAFNYQISTNGESPCSNNFRLQVPAADSLNYQWYRNGIALTGETAAQLQVSTGEGQYQVRISGPDGCKVTNAYQHVIPVERSFISDMLCEGERLRFGNRWLSAQGTYLDTVKTAEHCDSIIELQLTEVFNQTNVVNAKIFENEAYKLGRFTFREPGIYPVTLTSSVGCDSLVNLHLSWYRVYTPTAFSPNGDGVNDTFTILGDQADLVLIKSLRIFDKWGNLAFSREDLPPNDLSAGWDGSRQGTLLPAGVYVYTAQLEMNDGLERRFSGSVSLIR